MPTWKKVLLEGDNVAAESVQAGDFPGAGYTFPGAVAVDTINEYTANTGVTIDGLLLKDGNANFTWTDWTPTVTQSGSVSVTINEAKYCVVGKVCHLFAHLTVTGTGTAGYDIKIGGTPAALVPAHGTGNYGMAVLQDSSDYYKFWSGIARYWSGNGWMIMVSGYTGGVGYAPSLAAGNNDIIELFATYRIA